MTLPAPSFPSATLAVARFAFLRHLRSRRTVIALVTLLLIVGAVIAARAVAKQPGERAWNSSVEVLLSFASYAIPFLFHATAFSEEHADRTITYLLVRPVSRSAIVLGKYLAGSAFVVLFLTATTLLLSAASHVGASETFDARALALTWLGATLLSLGHSAIAAMWSAIAPEQATPLTVVHFAVFELGLASLPSVIPLLSMHHHAKDIIGLPRDSMLSSTPTIPLAGSVGALFVLTSLYLAFAFAIASAREYRFSRA